MTDKTFAEGIYWRAPHQKAPDFIHGTLSFKVAEVVAFLEMHENDAGYVNVVMKESKKGTVYFELDLWQPNQDQKPTPPPEDEITEESLPF